MDIWKHKNKNSALNKLTSYMEKNEIAISQMKWKERISFYKMKNVSLSLFFFKYNLQHKDLLRISKMFNKLGPLINKQKKTNLKQTNLH